MKRTGLPRFPPPIPHLPSSGNLPAPQQPQPLLPRFPLPIPHLPFSGNLPGAPPLLPQQLAAVAFWQQQMLNQPVQPFNIPQHRPRSPVPREEQRPSKKGKYKPPCNCGAVAATRQARAEEGTRSGHGGRVVRHETWCSSKNNPACFLSRWFCVFCAPRAICKSPRFGLIKAPRNKRLYTGINRTWGFSIAFPSPLSLSDLSPLSPPPGRGGGAGGGGGGDWGG